MAQTPQGGRNSSGSKGGVWVFSSAAELAVLPAVGPTQSPSDLALSHTVLPRAAFSGKGEPRGNRTHISDPQRENVSQEKNQKQT